MAGENNKVEDIVSEMNEEDSARIQNGANGGANGSCDEVDDGLGSSFYKSTEKMHEAWMPVSIDATFYNMDHKRCGIAVILNHENFDSQPKRTGTNVDCENLKKSLTKLGFDVQIYHDQKFEEIVDILDKVSKIDHSDSDCFLLACLSHGKENYLYANNTVYTVDTLWSSFTADKCPSLAGKPKLFFIQACQGSKLDSGVLLKTQVDSNPAYRIPTHADFLIAYATVPGFKSWPEVPSEGSWFIKALCEELSEHGFTVDLLSMLTTVNHKVAISYESNVPENLDKHQKKQIPCMTSMLTRRLLFSKKQQNNEID